MLVQFDGAQSYDPEGRPLSYFWDFGECCDYLQDPSPVHLYSLPDTYDVRLKVTDDVGRYHYAFPTIQVEYGPSAIEPSTWGRIKSLYR